jgi:hypothetical protein
MRLYRSIALLGTCTLVQIEAKPRPQISRATDAVVVSIVNDVAMRCLLTISQQERSPLESAIQKGYHNLTQTGGKKQASGTKWRNQGQHTEIA